MQVREALRSDEAGDRLSEKPQDIRADLISSRTSTCSPLTLSMASAVAIFDGGGNGGAVAASSATASSYAGGASHGGLARSTRWVRTPHAARHQGL